MQGKVDKISEGKNDFGKFINLTIDGKQYSAFGQSVVSQAAQVQAGDTVEFTFEVKQGKYNNIKTISVITGGATASTSNGPASVKVDQRDAMMLLSYAKDLVTVGGLEPAKAVETIFLMKKDVFDRLAGLNPTA